MNLDRINAALKKTNAHINGKRNFLEKVCSLQIDHEQIQCSRNRMRVLTPFVTTDCGTVSNIQLELAMYTQEHSREEIYDYIKDGIVSHNPKFRFTFNAAASTYTVYKEIPFNDLPAATIEYLNSLYYKNYDNIQGSYLESNTDEHDYTAFRQDFGAIFSTLFDGYLPGVCVTSRLAHGDINRVRSVKYDAEGIRREQIMQSLIDDHGLEGTLEPIGDDTAFNFEVLGYSEINIIDAITRISILAPGRGYEKFDDDTDAIFEAWSNGAPV